MKCPLLPPLYWRNQYGGGTGSVFGAFVGSLLMGMINNGLILAGLDVSQQTIIKGIIIILAVALSNVSKQTKKQITELKTVGIMI